MVQKVWRTSLSSGPDTSKGGSGGFVAQIDWYNTQPSYSAGNAKGILLLNTLLHFGRVGGTFGCRVISFFASGWFTERSVLDVIAQ